MHFVPRTKVSSIVRDSLRIGHFSVQTPESRSAERHRRAAYTAVASGVARAIGIGTTLVTIPLALSYLSTERFGLWITISSLQMFLNFADLGIGNGVLNAVADASGRGDLLLIRRHISSGLFLLSSIAVLIIFTLFATYDAFPWADFLNLHSQLARTEVAPAMAAFAICFAIDIPIGLVQRVQLGLQLGYVSNFWQIVGSLMALMGVLVVISARGSLPLLVLAFCGAPVAARLLNGVLFFGRVHRELVPSPRLISQDSIRKISRLALLFLVLQLAVGLAYHSDHLIISHFLGPQALTHYALPQKLFSLISFAVATLIGPLWPAYAEAVACGDKIWAKRTLVRSLLLATSVSTLLATLLVMFGPQILRLWVGPNIQPSYILLVGLGLWAIVEAGGNAVAMFLNGASIVKVQVVIVSVFALCAVVLKSTFVLHWGINAIPWATLIAYLLLTAIPYVIIVPRIVSQMCGSSKAGVQSGPKEQEAVWA